MTSATSPMLGLDIGTSRIVLGSGQPGDYQFRSQLNAFVTLPFSKLTEQVLRKRAVPYSKQGGDLLVYGDEAENFADLFHGETRQPMRGGVLNPKEADATQLVRAIIARLALDAGAEAGSVCVSVPAPALNGGPDVGYHESVVKQLCAEIGFQATSIHEGLAVVYSELAENDYTGIGVSCGAGMCNVTLAYLSVPIVSFSITRAGDFVDQSAAAATGEVATRVRLIKEGSFYFNGRHGDKLLDAVSVYYEAMIADLVAAMNEAFSSCRDLRKLRQPVPVVLSGGSAMPRGFRERFETALKGSGFPMAISDVRLSPDPLTATAKGALISLLADA